MNYASAPFQFASKFLLLALLLIGSGSLAAQAGADDIPENASAKRYGSGWTCDSGYRETGGLCALLEVPENAFVTKSDRRRGWECSRGYTIEDESCAAVFLPTNAYLDTIRGDSWKCNRGFRREDDACVVIVVPANGYLSDLSRGFGWKCDRGFSASTKTCDAIQLPDNAHLDYTGGNWACDRPYQKRSGECALP